MAVYFVVLKLFPFILLGLSLNVLVCTMGFCLVNVHIPKYVVPSASHLPAITNWVEQDLQE